MKLRNKKTGEIVDLCEGLIREDGEHITIKPVAVLEKCYTYNSLAELNEGWEDAPEEPKEGWYLDSLGKPIKKVFGDDDFIQTLEAIGNYFETREEAEQAVEKLKAWRRLKDTYHISFNLDFVKNTISFTYRINDTLHSAVDEERIVFEDMKTIFGGEE